MLAFVVFMLAQLTFEKNLLNLEKMDMGLSIYLRTYLDINAMNEL